LKKIIIPIYSILDLSADFSWKGVNLEDFIVVNFDRKVYYTKELLEVECAISTYAFEGMPAIRVASSNDRHTKEGRNKVHLFD